MVQLTNEYIYYMAKLNMAKLEMVKLIMNK